MAVSKRLRMEILRRDNYTCRYCGGSAPEVKLTVDHVVPVALGGSDEPGNLVAACVDCNAGKSSVSPDSSLVDNVQQDALRWSAALKEAARIAALADDSIQVGLDELDELWELKVYNWQGAPRARPESWREDVRRFHEAGLSFDEMKRAVLIVADKKGMDWDGYWRYFCGICWNRIRKIQETARALLEAEDGS